MSIWTFGIWITIAFAALIFVGCVLALVVLALMAIDVWRRPPVRPLDPETARMKLLCRQLDELWADEEDPMLERAADAAMWERELEATWRLA